MSHSIAILIGHSFIRRLRSSLLPDNMEVHGKQGRDISESRPHIAAIAAENAKVRESVSALYTSSNGINFVDDLWKSASTVTSLSPDIVVINIGSNDIARTRREDARAMFTLACSLTETADSFVKLYNVKRVVLLSTVPRDSSNMDCSADDFVLNMVHFNHYTETLCGEYPALEYCHLRGFYYKYVNNVEMPLSVHEWKTDGIHCNKAYTKKFIQRLRFAIMECSSKITISSH